jgi:hypothetical protein
VSRGIVIELPACDRVNAVYFVFPREPSWPWAAVWNDDGSNLYEQPNNKKLRNYSKEQWDPACRPQIHVNPPLRQYPKDVRNGIVGLNDDVRQVNVPNNLRTEERKGWAQRKKVYKGLHGELLLPCVEQP